MYMHMHLFEELFVENRREFTISDLAAIQEALLQQIPTFYL